MEPNESHGKETWETCGPWLGSIVLRSLDPWYRFGVSATHTWLIQKLVCSTSSDNPITKTKINDLLAPHVEWKAPNIIVLHCRIQGKTHHLFQWNSLWNLQYMVYPMQACFQHWKKKSVINILWERAIPTKSCARANLQRLARITCSPQSRKFNLTPSLSTRVICFPCKVLNLPWISSDPIDSILQMKKPKKVSNF